LAAQVIVFLFVRAALKGRHTLDRGATPGMNKTIKSALKGRLTRNPGELSKRNQTSSHPTSDI